MRERKPALLIGGNGENNTFSLPHRNDNTGIYSSVKGERIQKTPKIYEVFMSEEARIPEWESALTLLSLPAVAEGERSGLKLKVPYDCHHFLSGPSRRILDTPYPHNGSEEILRE